MTECSPADSRLRHVALWDFGTYINGGEPDPTWNEIDMARGWLAGGPISEPIHVA